MLLLAPHDPRLGWIAPRPPVTLALDTAPVVCRVERFPPSVATVLAGQPGPLANLRSAPGCGVQICTDSPWIVLQVAQLRHHQPIACVIGCEVEQEGIWRASGSVDLRPCDGAFALHLPTGLERGQPPARVRIWLPVISAASVAGIGVAAGSTVVEAPVERARWLAIGDSLTQGFSVACPTQTWVHQLVRRWRLPAWNLGVGGIRIEPQAFAWACTAQPWDLITITLGSNHAWGVDDADQVGDRAAALIACAGQAVSEHPGGNGRPRLVWCMPPWKPCEDGLGPGDFAGVPLTRGTGERLVRIRAAIRHAVATAPVRVDLVEDLMPHDHRLLPDGLHPQALGATRYAERLHAALAGPADGPIPGGPEPRPVA
jgi:hypothetical protein